MVRRFLGHLALDGRIPSAAIKPARRKRQEGEQQSDQPTQGT